MLKTTSLRKEIIRYLELIHNKYNAGSRCNRIRGRIFFVGENVISHFTIPGVVCIFPCVISSPPSAANKVDYIISNSSTYFNLSLGIGHCSIHHLSSRYDM